MANNKYNILWIDDEWDKMTTFQRECKELYGLYLEPFRTRKDGMDALDRDIDHWDAVLLDARMFDENDNERASLDGLRKAKQRLDELSIRRAIPYFISTGQPDLISDQIFKESFGEYYVKGNDDVKLVDDMLKAIENSDSQQVKAIYKDVFSGLDKIGVRQYVEPILMDILIPLHLPAKEPNFKPVYHFNQLRQLLEYLFRACNKVGLVPDQCMADGRVNLNQCSLYLAGKDAEKSGVRYGEKGKRIIPEYVESIIRAILEFGNIHSHTVELEEDDLQKIEGIFRTAQSRFIIFGLTLQICEAVIWFSEYIPKHDDKEVNLLLCNELQREESTRNEEDGANKYRNREFVPVKDEDGIWHCEECYVKITSWESGKMELTEISPNTDKRTNAKYPYFARYKIIYK
ncbi:MAG: hypothetical protein IJ154_06185 [Bacteroidales bacterium]|nr:hypothetical protein [Bacteroidales bacterium]